MFNQKKKPVTFYVDKELHEPFKTKCQEELQDTMKNVILVIARAFLHKSTKETDLYLRKVLSEFNYSISYNRNNLYRFRARLTNNELAELKNLADKHRTSMSKIICAIMQIVINTVNRENYSYNKNMVENELPDVNNYIVMELTITDKKLVEDLQNYIYYRFIKDLDTKVDDMDSYVAECINIVVTEALDEYLMNHLKDINIDINPLGFLRK